MDYEAIEMRKSTQQNRKKLGAGGKPSIESDD